MYLEYIGIRFLSTVLLQDICMRFGKMILYLYSLLLLFFYGSFDQVSLLIKKKRKTLNFEFSKPRAHHFIRMKLGTPLINVQYIQPLSIFIDLTGTT